MKSPRLKPLPVEQWTPGLLETARTITNGGIRADANVYPESLMRRLSTRPCESNRFDSRTGLPGS